MWEHSESAHARRFRVYLAAPLFSEAERDFNAYVADVLEDYVDVYLPQRDGGLMSTMIRNGVDQKVAARLVFRGDMEAIEECDWIVIVMDGRSIDEGAALELGVAYAYHKRCVGLQTDSRRLAPWGNNPMIAGALEREFGSVDELVQWVTTECVRSVERLSGAEGIAARA